ncbi:MAG: serine/threonine protein kinase, partial [Candidatus Aminicenantes bacterium]
MGIVYKALDPDIDREVAIKTIRFDLISDDEEKDELMLRFMREARAAGKLVHPNIITIHDVGKEKDMTYIVMQCIEGPSLQNWIASKKKFSAPDIIKLMLQLCDALNFAHESGIVHRDIKPANILLNQNGKPHICDFGVAHVEMSTITQTGATIGTPSYMSPEQVMGKKIDKRSDIFSLGAILYELLTGRRPFEGESITTVIYKIVNEEAVPLTQVRKELPPEFEQIMRRALAKDPNTRYGSCTELAADLKMIKHSSDETLAMTSVQESAFAVKAPAQKRKKLFLPLALAGAAIVIGGFFLYQKWAGSRSSSPDDSKPIILESVALDSRSMLSVLEVFETESEKLMKSYNRGNYSKAIQIAQSILAQDKQDQEALEYLAKARNKMSESQIAKYISAGKREYESGNYEQSKINMAEALKINSKNAEAQRYFDLADKELSEEAIRQIVDRQRKAEEQKDLLTFLSDIGPEALANKKRADAMQLFNNYDDINSRIADLSISFLDSDHADVSFSHLLVAVEKETGNNKVIFEGKKTLTLERLENTWKILVYR